MSRTERKCLLGSALLHGLLLLVLVVGSAFVREQKKPADNLETLTVIPAKLIDDALSGGGRPSTLPPPAAAAAAVAPPPPAQAEPRPAPVQPTPTPTPPKPAPSKVPSVVRDTALPAPTWNKPRKPEPEPEVTDRKPVTKPTTKREIKPELVKVERGVPDSTAKKPAVDTAAVARAEADAQQARAAAQAIAGLKSNLSGRTAIEPVGPGGEAYANYKQAIKSIYTEAWTPPEDFKDELASVEARITISRDGTIVSLRTRIVKPSGVASLDGTVNIVLERVRKVPPFPESSKDSERSFIINFNLKAKRDIG